MSSSPTNPREQQFCLRWNNYQSNLIQVFNQLFQTESFVDVTLACEGHSVKAHRIVLAACSPYFLTVLTETPCSHPVIILQGVKWTELKAIVEFMYKGEINISQDQLASLLRVAESLKVRGLADVGGEEAEAVLTSPTGSPRVPSQFWAEDTPRKRRRLSEEPRSRSRSRSPPSGPHTPHTPVANAAIESLETIPDLPGPPQSRGSSSASNPPPSLPSPSPVASLASSLSSLAHLHGPMPPPGPPIPHHLAHLPPLSPLSPLLNMHPMSRHHSPEDFEIRPGIAEMIREEERRRRDFPDMAKLLESTHHWIGNPMADRESSAHHLTEEKGLSPMKEALRRFCKSNDSSRYANTKLKTSSPFEKDFVPENSFPSNNSSVKYRSKGTSKWTQEDLASALMMVRNGTPIKPAAERFSIPVMTLWRRTRALGLVSSKVQCGFRYTSARGGFNSLQALSFHDTKTHERDPKSTFYDTKLQEKDPKLTFYDNKLQERDSKSTFHDTKPRERDPKSYFHDNKPQEKDPKSTFYDNKLQERDPKSSFHSTKPQEKDPKSTFHDTKPRERDPKSKLSLLQANDSPFFKERSPLTESNYKMCQSSDESLISSKFKSEEDSHKENSPDTSSTSSLLCPLTPTDVPLDSAGIKLDSIHEPNSKVPSKEFLVWLSCLGRKPLENTGTHLTNGSLQFKI